MNDVDTRDVETGVAVEIVYSILRSFNRSFHKVDLPAYEEANETEQAAAIQSYSWLKNNPEMPAPQVHEEWRKAMAGEGWDYGSEFSEENHTHPHLAPWGELPPWAKRMIYLTSTTVHVLSADIEDVEEAMQ